MCAESDSYLTITQESQAETKVKGSRFIGRAFKCDSRDAAEETLADMRKKEFDATHHCYAYIIRPPDTKESIDNSPDRQTFRYSDDGEPSGSAGKPIFDQISGRELVDTLVVVTRYYGGTKLGVGGLVRAYSDSASQVLEQAGVTKHYHYVSYQIEIEFSYYQQLLNLINALAGHVDDSEFSANVSLNARIRVSKAEEFQHKFTELTHGKGVISKQN